jgi:transposase
MREGIRWVGLDVHANQTAGAVFDTATGEVRSRKFPGRPHEVLPWLMELPAPVRAVYEAGPTGYGLARRARAAGIDMQVCAPGMIAKGPGDRVKTDKRDALKLARLHAAGQLVTVHVPVPEHEQLRDLARCREDVRGDLMRARHRIGKFLLRREIYYVGRGGGRGRAWTREHRSWLAGVRFADRPSELCFADYLHAHDVLLARRDALDRAITEIASDSPWAEIIGRLRCLHGIDTLSAFGICAEVGDFDRFLAPTAFSAYLGLVPSEHTSGDKRRQGAITKAGSAHARRLLVEAAHHYARPPRIGGALQRRQDGHEPWVIDLSWRAQRRLHARWRHLRTDRRRPGGVSAVAVARELAHYCWELAVH